MHNANEESMRYLFFDIECCNGRDICEFGYVITDENFIKIEKQDITINPVEKFHLTDRQNQKDLKLHFTEEEYYSSPKFTEYYNKIKTLIEAPDQIIVGHAIDNDARFLRTACKKYDLAPINFEFADSQKMYAEFFSEKVRISLEGASEKLELEKPLYLHKSDDDAFTTMNLVKGMCERLEVSLKELIYLCPTARGSSNNFNIQFYGNSINELLKAVETNAELLSNNKKKQCVLRFAERAVPQNEIIQSALTDKKICFSVVFERAKVKECIILIQLIVNHGGLYHTKVSECDYYVKVEEDDISADISGTRYHHILEAMNDSNKIKIISFEDLYKMLDITESEIATIPVPRIKKQRRQISMHNNVSSGITIGELLKAQGKKIY